MRILVFYGCVLLLASTIEMKAQTAPDTTKTESTQDSRRRRIKYKKEDAKKKESKSWLNKIDNVIIMGEGEEKDASASLATRGFDEFDFKSGRKPYNNVNIKISAEEFDQFQKQRKVGKYFMDQSSGQSNQ